LCFDEFQFKSRKPAGRFCERINRVEIYNAVDKARVHRHSNNDKKI